MSEPAQSPILAAALDAWDAGLSVVRVRTDGSKRPVGEWKQYQTVRADRDTVAQWFTNTAHGLGVICGAVSGDLEMLELEGRFVTEHSTKAFLRAMKDAGLELLLRRLVNGFMVTSPSDGRHFYYRVDGEATANTKLARRPSTDDELAAHPTALVQVLIETRGEGGFVVAPPSGGTVHPTGKEWKTKAGSYAAIPIITVAEREALFEVCRSFDSYGTEPAPAGTPVAPGQRVKLTRSSGRVGDSWMDAVVDHLRHTIPMTGLLEHYGWAPAYTDRHGRQLMTRPGKEDGVSGSVNASDRLHVFSTSVPLAAGGKTTHDQLDVIAAYEHHGDRQQAARSIAERTGILDAWKAAQAPRATVVPPANVDPATGEILAAPAVGGDPPDASNGPLNDDFWNARPHLAHIHQAAKSRMVAPAAVLGCIIARVAAFTPPSTRLPPIIGSASTLTTYIALRARSGGGKSTSTGCAADLLPDTPPGCVGPLPVGSGEGLIDAYFELVEDTDGGGKKVKVKRQTRRGALFILDEGQALAEMGSRRGATILPTLRTAWSGADVGQANASLETRRMMKSGTYALGLVSLWQDPAAARLLDDVDGGTPQRFVFIDTGDADTDADNCPEWPGQLDWAPGPVYTIPKLLDVDPAIVREIRHAHAAAQRGDVVIAPLDAHRRLVKLKVAGVLGVLDGRDSINPDDWELAERIMAHSDSVRGWISAEAARRRQAEQMAGTLRQVEREAVLEGSSVQRALLRAAKVAYRAAEKAAPDPITKRDLHHAIASRDRQLVTTTEVLAEAVRLRWLTHRDDESWVLGDGKPA
jgi:hypothetical protein